MDNSSQNNQFEPSPGSLAYLVCCFDESRKLGGKVVRRHSPGRMPQKILSILKTHTGRAQTPAKCVFEVVDANFGKPVSGVVLAS